MNKRVLVAMSGGVDSSVTTALLGKQGMTVEGVTMKLTAGSCCDIGSAAAVCSQLKIPHRILQAQDEFSRAVVRDFISEYRSGRTPNPCIRCNELIKFSLLLEYARAQGFDFLATGHYARIEQEGPRYSLKRGADEKKDQSYFLYRLTQEQMKSILLPLGSMTKAEVRTIARSLQLPAAERPESQEVCFVPDNDYRSFLREHAPGTVTPGEIVLTDGTVLGSHEGVAFFTVGQRRNLGIAAGERLYVIRIEPATKRVVLGRLKELRRHDFLVTNASFVSGDAVKSPMSITLKIRYRAPLVPALIEPSGGEFRVTVEQGVTGVCPGQAAVFYDGGSVVGGGIISAQTSG